MRTGIGHHERAARRAEPHVDVGIETEPDGDPIELRQGGPVEIGFELVDVAHGHSPSAPGAARPASGRRGHRSRRPRVPAPGWAAPSRGCRGRDTSAPPAGGAGRTKAVSTASAFTRMRKVAPGARGAVLVHLLDGDRRGGEARARGWRGRASPPSSAPCRRDGSRRDPELVAPEEVRRWNTGSARRRAIRRRVKSSCAAAVADGLHVIHVSGPSWQ